MTSSTGTDRARYGLRSKPLRVAPRTRMRTGHRSSATSDSRSSGSCPSWRSASDTWWRLSLIERRRVRKDEGR